MTNSVAKPTSAELWERYVAGTLTLEEWNAIDPVSPERAAELRAKPLRGLWDEVIERMEARRAKACSQAQAR